MGLHVREGESAVSPLEIFYLPSWASEPFLVGGGAFGRGSNAVENSDACGDLLYCRVEGWFLVEKEEIARRACVHACVCASVRAFVRAFVRMCVRACLVRAFVRACLCVYVCVEPALEMAIEIFLLGVPSAL